MSEILEKYELAFTYNNDNCKTTVSSVSPLLSDYINNAAITQVKEVYNELRHTLKYYKSGDRNVTWTKDFAIKLTAEGVNIIYHGHENPTKFIEPLFTLPAEDFLSILQTWRDFLAPHKVRQIEVKNGRGIIDIISDYFITALVVERPVSATWPDCMGSIGEYYAVSHENYDRQKELTANLIQALSSGFDEEIFAAITIFLDLFTNGTYQVTIGAADVHSAELVYYRTITYADTVTEDEMFTYGFDHYGYGEVILFSRSFETINQNRVTEYVEIIKNGGRPKIVLFNSFAGEHVNVIDGHHKLLAYEQLGINAPAVIITKAQLAQQLHKNIIVPKLLNFLKPAEVIHILQNNDIRDVEIYKASKISCYIDKILSTKKSIGITITEMLYNVYNSIDKDNTDWAKQKLLLLSKNKYQGRGQVLYYRTIDPEKNHTVWRPIYIENNDDFEIWKKIFLNNGEIPADMDERQKEIQKRYYPPYQPPKKDDMVVPKVQKKQTFDEPVVNRSIWRTLFRILLMCLLFLSLFRGCNKAKASDRFQPKKVRLTDAREKPED